MKYLINIVTYCQWTHICTVPKRIKRIQYSFSSIILKNTVMLWTERMSAGTLHSEPRRQPNNPRSFVSKKLLIYLFLSTQSSFYCSYPLACRLRAHKCWPSEAHRSAAGLARHGAWPPPSRGAQLTALLGVVRCCALQVAPPMPPFGDVQPLPLARRL
jgi:hypothetical protein